MKPRQIVAPELQRGFVFGANQRDQDRSVDPQRLAQLLQRAGQRLVGALAQLREQDQSLRPLGLLGRLADGGLGGMRIGAAGFQQRLRGPGETLTQPGCELLGLVREASPDQRGNRWAGIAKPAAESSADAPAAPAGADSASSSPCTSLGRGPCQSPGFGSASIRSNRR